MATNPYACIRFYDRYYPVFLAAPYSHNSELSHLRAQYYPCTCSAEIDDGYLNLNPVKMGGIEEGAPEESTYKGAVNPSIRRTFEEEMQFITELTPWKYEIAKGFVPNMNVEGTFYVNNALIGLIKEELKHHCSSDGYGGFLPAVKQIANVAALPGIVKSSIAMPDCHSGYGFAIGNVAAFDIDNPESIVSPGGVGFDINCGVR